MKLIYDVSDIPKISKILDRKDLYVTCAVEGNVVAFTLRQEQKEGPEVICEHVLIHIPEEA